jgi:hypothetical protein
MESKHNPLAPPRKYYHTQRQKFEQMLELLTPSEWLRLHYLFAEEWTHVTDLMMAIDNGNLTIEAIE